jgi:NADH:ubiquinone oxidoreductase subunit 5 (subunit L)/multisubunit Na+/H+ antiporter MnhA subunit
MLFSVLYQKKKKKIFTYSFVCLFVCLLVFVSYVPFNSLFCFYGFKFLSLANWLLIQHFHKQEFNNDDNDNNNNNK